MRVWIDGQCLQTSSTQRGIGRYVQELICGLATHCPEVELSISFNAAMADEAIAARRLVGRWITPNNIHIWQGIAEGGEALEGLGERRQLSEIALAHHVAGLEPDVAVSASPFEGAGDKAVPLLPDEALDMPVAAIFFDAIPYRYRREYLKTAAMTAFYERRFKAHNRFDHLLGISQFANSEATELFPGVRCCSIEAGPSSSLLPAIERIERGLAPCELPASVRRPYLLYVGALDWRKNVGVVVDACQRLPKSVMASLTFVVAGYYSADAAEEILNRWQKNGLPADHIQMLGRVSDDALARLYREASLVIQPALMEGFGLTALEAMICGAPVIGAKAGALPEVIGDERALFDPNNPDQIAGMIAEVHLDPKLARSLVERGRVQAGKFSWKRSAELTVDALRELHAGCRKRPAGTQEERLAARRRGVATRARRFSVDAETTVKLLSSAESRSEEAPHLIVDISGTTAADFGTGIQRVAHNIVRCWSSAEARASLPLQLVSCSATDHYSQIELSNAADKARFRIDAHTQPKLGHGGTVLLLDGSWEYHARHAVLLRKARLQGCEVITTLYDLIPLQASAFCDRGVPEAFCAGLRVSLQLATGFVCISKAVADQLAALLEAIRFPRQMKIGYWHLGADFARSSPRLPDVAQPRGLDQIESPTAPSSAPVATFLMVGTLEPRKGHRLAIEAFSELWRTGVDAKLVIIGKKGWGVDRLASDIAAHPEFGRRLLWLDRLTDAELAGHYAQCDAVIAASFAEGFGLPIVEAGYFDKAVIASDIEVFREVAAAVPTHAFFKAGSATALSGAVREFLAGRQGRGRSPAGDRRAWLSWRESAIELDKVVLGSNWYRTYRPAAPSGDAVPLTHIGDTRMQAPIKEGDRKHEIELVEGPSLSGDGRSFQLVVALANHSTVVWASAGPGNAALGIFLGCRVVDRSGLPAGIASRAEIPFVLAPGERHFMALAVRSDARRRGGEYVDIEVVQETVGWWGNALRVKLPTS